jgi:hypothetical protein
VTQKLYQWTVKCSRDSVLGKAEIGGEGQLAEVKAILGNYLADLMLKYPPYKSVLGQVRTSLDHTNGYCWYRTATIPLTFGAVDIHMTLELKKVPDSQPPGVVRQRIGRAQREQVTERLLTALEDESLDEVEFDRRNAIVLASVYADELPPLTADLPLPNAGELTVPVDQKAAPALRRKRADRSVAAVFLILGTAALVMSEIISSLTGKELLQMIAMITLVVAIALTVAVHERSDNVR